MTCLYTPTKMAKFRTLTPTNAGEDIEQQELSFIDGRNTKWEERLGVSFKTKHTLATWSSNHLPWYLLKGVESLHPHKNLHMYINCNGTHNC